MFRTTGTYALLQHPCPLLASFGSFLPPFGAFTSSLCPCALARSALDLSQCLCTITCHFMTGGQQLLIGQRGGSCTSAFGLELFLVSLKTPSPPPLQTFPSLLLHPPPPPEPFQPFSTSFGSLQGPPCSSKISELFLSLYLPLLPPCLLLDFSRC